MAMNDDVVPDASRYEELRLIRAFLRLTDPGRRQKVLECAERLAQEAASAAATPALVATDASEPVRDVARPTE
ncbi:hypothetical protein C7U92_16690 [Bradyrhizobium sp. WBOS7]|uniref:Uncharacterized protein n=2 Tax=Nitrobacteraceae TaxID=41294 RepID=A0AAE9NAT8_9BRAD|nr:hypothetical protein [Bradyrhizobium sp. WBOS2]MDD1570600.1 hypothetical protein [Bradyrhizobium sp. WBOS1]MDD1578358.1 hypothetical protein [Bradyrhizobium sp. WBOS7]MDD1601081.1 hypothetical protein [Bradyrhizobium sp. WBOS16]UUO34935.1 hypothetical protein DCK84_10455 [Bradyrhizobium sp. WBOS01]UUO41264.1 hypothetical protein DCM75_11305 [Bradyrhizobium sp. WBOS02]UUO55581.1 hypothetical protein DCM79_23000 [Bradyrhizobium sp. WBOS07]UUO65630.1 hypothetical protein DCM83_10785 [Bradyrh